MRFTKLLEVKKVESYLIPVEVETQLLTEDLETEPRKAIPVVMRNEREVVLSNQLISAHNVKLENVAEGLWRLGNENKIRKSEKPQYW